jgi:hypothetical protein
MIITPIMLVTEMAKSFKNISWVRKKIRLRLNRSLMNIKLKLRKRSFSGGICKKMYLISIKPNTTILWKIYNN